MIRQGSSVITGEKMLLGNNRSDLFGDESRKGVLKVIQGRNCIAPPCTFDQTYVKNTDYTPRSRNPPADSFLFPST